MAVRQSFAVVSMAVRRPSTMCISKTSAMVVDGLPAWAKYTYEKVELSLLFVHEAFTPQWRPSKQL